MVKEKEEEDLEDSINLGWWTQKTNDTLLKGFNTDDNKSSNREFEEKSIKVSEKLSMKLYPPKEKVSSKHSSSSSSSSSSDKQKSKKSSSKKKSDDYSEDFN